MARLSTANSGGKANLHQGAVGVGIDIGTGRALRAIQLANGLGLQKQLDIVDAHCTTFKQCKEYAQSVDFSMQHFQEICVLSYVLLLGPT